MWLLLERIPPYIIGELKNDKGNDEPNASNGGLLVNQLAEHFNFVEEFILSSQ